MKQSGKHHSLFTLIALIFSLSAFAQNSSIVGSVEDASGKPLQYASVYLEGTDYGVATDANGSYRLDNIPEGTYTLKISNLGYETFSLDLNLANGQALNLNTKLEVAIAVLPEITVMVGNEEEVRRTPGSVSYISPKQIEKFEYTDVNRTLTMVPGVNIQEEDGFGLRPNIGLRGTGVERSSKITIMEDGVLMAPAPYSAPAAYYFPTSGRMNAVEVMKGASQIKYGPYTTGGAINLISTPIPNSFRAKAQITGGSFGTSTIHTHVGSKVKQFSYLLEFFDYRSNGFKEIPRGTTGFHKFDLLAKAKVESKAGARFPQSLTVKLGRSSEESNETYLGLTEADFNNDPYQRYVGSQMDKMTTEHMQYSLTHQIKFNDNVSLSTTAYLNEFKRNWYKLDKVRESDGNFVSIGNILDNPTEYDTAFAIVAGNMDTQGEGVLNLKANNRSYYSRGVQSVIHVDLNAANFTHGFDLGIRIHEDQIDRFQWVDSYDIDNTFMHLITAGQPGTESNRVQTANALASYLQYKIQYKGLTVKPGIRYEDVKQVRIDYGKTDPDRVGTDISERENSTSTFIPGIGVDYKFNEHLSSFVGVHKGFAPAGSTEGSMPEESVNYELGIRDFHPNFSTELVLFMNQYSNLQGSDLAASGGAGTGEMYNAGQVLTQGIEFQMAYNLLASADASFSLPINLSYTYTDATFLNTFDSDFDGWGSVEEGDEMPYLAKHRFSIGLTAETDKFELNVNTRLVSDMRTNPGQGDIAETQKIPAHMVMDLALNVPIKEKFTAKLAINNLTDNAYLVARRPAGLRPGMPRAIFVGIKANL